MRTTTTATRFKAFTTGVVVNNLIYNPGARAIAVDYNESEWEGTGIRPRNARIAVVGNVFVPGAAKVTEYVLQHAGARPNGYPKTAPVRRKPANP